MWQTCEYDKVTAYIYFLELSFGMYQQYAGLEAGLSIKSMCSTLHYRVLSVFLRQKFTKHSFAEDITFIHQKS
jgi:hypothetical protein